VSWLYACLAQDLAGKWEGTYSESRRVIVFAIDFESETKGTLQILGRRIPILAMRSERSLDATTGLVDVVFTHVGAVYFQYNRSASDPQSPIPQFEKELSKALNAHPKAALIVDLRCNTGGDGNVGRQMMDELQAASTSRRVYVIVGRTTFSAGLFHAVQWIHWGKASFVGEEPGDSLEFFAEGGNIQLPNSRLTIHFANAKHCYSAASKTPASECFNELRVESLAIRLPATNTFDQYRSGSDAAFATIAADLKKNACK
jgi:hypothetical protein